MPTSYETEVRIVLDALKAGLPGKGNGAPAPDIAGVRYTEDGKPTIAVTFVSGTIIAKTEGLSAIQGGFTFNEGADEAGARTIAARIVEWVSSH
jgi:hypothetical protein